MCKCRRPTIRHRAWVSTFYTSIPCANVDVLLFITVGEYRLPTPLYRAQISMLHSSLPPVSIDAPHFSTVRKCRRPTPRYLAWVSTPHNSISRTNIEAKHFVTVRREYWSNLLPHLVSLLFKKMRRKGSGYLLFWPSAWELAHSKQWCISTCCFGFFWSNIENVPFRTQETKIIDNTWNITNF